eukprot:5985623-Prymnesium_polylepis.1
MGDGFVPRLSQPAVVVRIADALPKKGGSSTEIVPATPTSIASTKSRHGKRGANPIRVVVRVRPALRDARLVPIHAKCEPRIGHHVEVGGRSR